MFEFPDNQYTNEFLKHYLILGWGILYSERLYLYLSVAVLVIFLNVGDFLGSFFLLPSVENHRQVEEIKETK